VGYLFALLAALLFGANGSLTKLVIEAGLTPMQLTQFRTLGTALLAGALLLTLDRAAFRLRPRQLLVMAALGVGGVALLQASYAAAIQLLPVGIALLLEYTAVLMVALFAFFVFRERVKARIWVAIAFVLAGLAVVAQIWSSRLDPLGVALALVAAVTLAFYFLVGEGQVGATSPLTVAFWTMVFATAFWAPFSGWWTLQPSTFSAHVEVGGMLGSLALPLWLPLTITVVVGSFAPFLLSFYALKHLTATAAGIVASSEVLFAFVVAWFWLGEQLDPLQIAGAAVVLAGIVLAQTARSGKTVVDADLALRTGPVAQP
jgi:drug/metabolite transporter (DMT)-like permease